MYGDTGMKTEESGMDVDNVGHSVCDILAEEVNSDRIKLFSIFCVLYLNYWVIS